MGLNNEYADTRSPIVVDIETTGLSNAADYLEPVQAARNLKDPEKIAADIEARSAERSSKVALDWNVGRIVALGCWMAHTGGMSYLGPTEAEEGAAIEAFWSLAKGRTIVGFNIKGFDLRFLIQRSRFLGISYPDVDLSKYNRKGVRDLYLDLTFNDGTYDQGVMRRGLKSFCRRFGIPVTDTTDGAEIPALVARGEWDAIRAHVEADVSLTVELARKLGAL